MDDVLGFGFHTLSFSFLFFPYIHESDRRQRGIARSLVVPAFVFLALLLLHKDSVTEAINSLRVLSSRCIQLGNINM